MPGNHQNEDLDGIPQVRNGPPPELSDLTQRNIVQAIMTAEEKTRKWGNGAPKNIFQCNNDPRSFLLRRRNHGYKVNPLNCSTDQHNRRI